jgi:hypothetical protein
MMPIDKYDMTPLLTFLKRLGLKSAKPQVTMYTMTSILKELYGQQDILDKLIYSDNAFLKLIQKKDNNES